MKCRVCGSNKILKTKDYRNLYYCDNDICPVNKILMARKWLSERKLKEVYTLKEIKELLKTLKA